MSYQEYNSVKSSFVSAGYKRPEGDYRDPKTTFSEFTDENREAKRLLKQEKWRDVNAAKKDNQFCIPESISNSEEGQRMLQLEREKISRELLPWRMCQSSSGEQTYLTANGLIVDIYRGMARGSNYSNYEGTGLKGFTFGFKIHIFRPALRNNPELVVGAWRIVIIQLRVANSVVTTLDDVWTTNLGPASLRPYGFLSYTFRNNAKIIYNMPFGLGMCKGNFQLDGFATTVKSSNQYLKVEWDGKDMDPVKFDSLGNIQKGGILALIIGDDESVGVNTPLVHYSSFTRYRTN